MTKKGPNTIDVLLVDMEDLVRSGFSLALRNEPDINVIAEANSGDVVVALAKRFRPDVIIMDIWMPDFDSTIEIMRRIGEISDQDIPKIIVLTSFHDDQYLFRSLRAGASGFLLKGTSREELVGAVRQVARGHAVVCPAMTRRLLDRFEIRPMRSHVARAGVAQELLSKRELQVLHRVASGQSNQEIATDLYLTSATVKSHVSNLLSKLQLRDRVQAALFAYETGLVRPMSSDYHWRSDDGSVSAQRRRYA